MTTCKIRKAGLLLLSVCLCACMFGCKSPEKKPAQSTASETVTELKPKLEIQKLLTAKDVSDGMKLDMTGPEIGEENTLLLFHNQAYTVTVQLSVEETTADVFDDMLTQFSKVEELPNLWKKAVWSPEASQVRVYTGKYSVMVMVDKDGLSEAQKIVYCRYFAAIAMGRLPE